MKYIGILCVLLAISLPVCADDWTAVESAPVAGIPAESWKHLVTHFREKPYSVDELRPCLEVVANAAGEGLPVETILTRIEEGVAKQVGATALEQSVRQRLDSLRRAKVVLEQAGTKESITGRQRELIPVVASALESQVTVAGLRRAVEHGSSLRLCRLKTAISTGESLKLMGLDDETVASFMDDFVTRRLCCGETLRAARLVGEQHRAGVGGPKIRELLWGRGTGGTLAPRWQRRRGHESSDDDTDDTTSPGRGRGPRGRS